jgi:hypothetical protein
VKASGSGCRSATTGNGMPTIVRRRENTRHYSWTPISDAP